MSTIVTGVVGVYNLLGPKLAQRSMKLLYREYLMYLKGIGLKERRNGRGGWEAGR